MYGIVSEHKLVGAAIFTCLRDRIVVAAVSTDSLHNAKIWLMHECSRITVYRCAQLCFEIIENKEVRFDGCLAYWPHEAYMIKRLNGFTYFTETHTAFVFLFSSKGRIV